MKTPSQLIDARIKELNDWRGKALSQIRELILKADSKIIEEWKWDVPTWSQNGIICTGETYKDKVKLTFPKGSKIKDPKKLFNQGTGVRRAINILEGDKINATAFKALIKEAVKTNKK